MNTYNFEFYNAQAEISYRSARKVVPIVVNLLSPRSVVDVGCGVGTWLSAFEEHGIAITGLEGAWVSAQPLRIDQKHVRVVDLNSSFSLKEKYDCAISLEVAEHLDPERGPGFVADICELSDIIVFGAAIPGQGGTDHRNERFQSYWAAEFQKNGFRAFDVVRPAIWHDRQVGPAYRQNILVYAREGSGAFQHLVLSNSRSQIIHDIVHPEIFSRQIMRTELFEKSKTVRAVGAFKTAFGLLRR
jgi:SAM-dependent methyltransferase